MSNKRLWKELELSDYAIILTSGLYRLVLDRHPKTDNVRVHVSRRQRVGGRLTKFVCTQDHYVKATAIDILSVLPFGVVSRPTVDEFLEHLPIRRKGKRLTESQRRTVLCLIGAAELLVGNLLAIYKQRPRVGHTKKQWQHLLQAAHHLAEATR